VSPVPAAPVSSTSRGLRASSSSSGVKTRAKKPAPPKIQAQLDEHLALYQERDNKSLYELLGLTEQASADEVKTRFKKIAGSLHIDKYLRFDLPEESLDALKKLFILLNQAQQTLSDPEARREYDLSRQLSSRAASAEGGAAPSGPSAQRDLGQLLQAEQLVREAIQLLKHSKVELAESKLSAARALNDDDPLGDATGLYIEVLKLRAQGASNAVINSVADKLEVLTGSYDSREEPFYFLGMARVMTGDMKRAVSALERAVEINPHYAEANSQLRFAQRQSQGGASAKSPKSGGGLFGRRK